MTPAMRGKLLGAVLLVAGLVGIAVTTGLNAAWWPPLAAIAVAAVGALIWDRADRVRRR